MSWCSDKLPALSSSDVAVWLREWMGHVPTDAAGRGHSSAPVATPDDQIRQQRNTLVLGAIDGWPSSSDVAVWLREWMVLSPAGRCEQVATAVQLGTDKGEMIETDLARHCTDTFR
jgi:hypothetical protein